MFWMDYEDRIKVNKRDLVGHARFLAATSDKIAKDADALIAAFCNSEWKDAVYSIVAPVLDDHAKAMNDILSQLDGTVAQLNELIDLLTKYFDTAGRL